ncbi:hypothetical protein Tco_0016799 [Tanacetum coccineum]
MLTLTFTDTHNMVAFLENPAESDGFHEIIDFPNANQICYALTVNPTIYTSCIQYQAFKVIFTWEMQELGDMSHHKKIYVNPSHTKKIFANMKREGNDFSGRVTPLFATMMVQPNQEEGVDSGIPTDSHQTPITTQPSSRSQKQSRRKQRKDTAVTQEEPQQDDSVPTPSNNPLISEEGPEVGKEEEIKNYRVKKAKESWYGLEVKSSKDKDSLGGLDDAEMFDINELHGDEIVWILQYGENKEQSAKDRELPKVVTYCYYNNNKIQAKGLEGYCSEPSEFKTLQASQPLMTKGKGKAIMIEPEVPLKRKDQVALDEDLARNLQAQLEAELIEEERIARKQEEEANIALIESWDNT